MITIGVFLPGYPTFNLDDFKVGTVGAINSYYSGALKDSKQGEVSSGTRN